jgi:hypothetical protein
MLGGRDELPNGSSDGGFGDRLIAVDRWNC